MRTLERLLEIVAAFPKATVLGVGDLILDQYRRGKAVGLSPEAPAIELLNPGLSATPGGAANVAWNIGHLGGQVQMIGVVGADTEGTTLRRLLTETPGVSPILIEDAGRPTTLKLRYYHEQFQVLRVSQESKEPLSAAVNGAVERAILDRAEGCGAVFIEDYGKQLINSEMVGTLLELRRSRSDLPVILDPKIGNHHMYRRGLCTLLKPNWNEACALADQEPETANREHVARTLADRYACDVLITLGSDGAYAYERARSHGALVPTRPREAFDIAGAGDTTLAAVALSLASGAALREAAILANLAGGIVVEKSGTAYATPEELAADIGHPVTQEILATIEAATETPARERAATPHAEEKRRRA